MKNLFKNILENIQTPVCVFDSKGDLLFLNKAILEIESREGLNKLVFDILMQENIKLPFNFGRIVSGFEYNIIVKTIESDLENFYLAEFTSDDADKIKAFSDSIVPTIREVDNFIVSTNKAFNQLLGYPLEAGTSLKELFYSAELEKIASYKAKVIQNGNKNNHITLHLKTRKQISIICNVAVEIKEDANYYSFWDVSNILSKYDKLLKEHNRLLKLIDVIPVALFALDKQDDIILWNKAATYFSGIESHIAINKNWKEIFLQFTAENYLTKDFFQAIDLKRELVNEELEFSLADKRRVLSFTTFKNEHPISNISYWGIAVDITEAKISEEEHQELIEELTASRDTITQDAFRAISLNERLADSEEQLRQANATKDKFFSIIAHDLKSPIHSFTNLTEVIINEFDRLEKDETLELLQAIFSSAKQITSLLENLLQWSRTQSNRISIQPENIHLDQLIEHNLSLLNQNAANKKITLEHKSYGNQIAYADENMIYTVLRNLISNAIKFTHPEGRILVISKGHADTVEVSVTDNGVGMRQEDVDNLFRIDVYHSTMGTQREKGTGLGLILCHEFMQKNQGKLFVKSELGKGSTFTFELPIGNNVTPEEFREESNQAEALKEEVCLEILSEHSPVLTIDLNDVKSEFLKDLKAKWVPEAQELIDTMLIDDIAEFAKRLLKTSKEHEMKQLVDFAINLHNSCENFDLIEIENSLNAFTTIEI